MDLMKLSSLYFTRDIVRELLPHIHGETVDLGAGLSRYRQMILGKTDKYTTMDIQKFPGIDVVGDLLKLPFADNTFDTALSFQVLEHVKEPWTAAKEIARILRPGGTAIVTAPFVYPFHACPNDFYRWTKMGLREELSAGKLQYLWKFGESGAGGRVF